MNLHMPGLSKPPRATQPQKQHTPTHALGFAAGSSAGFWLQGWRSSDEELCYGRRSSLADRKQPCVAVVRRRYQHHTVSTSTTSVLSASDLAPAFAGIVVLCHVNEPPLPAGDWQHDGSTYTSIESVTVARPTASTAPAHLSHAVVQQLTNTGLYIVRGCGVDSWRGGKACQAPGSGTA
jgi:hypothetical protein